MATTTLLSVRETARRLGVHENTVRNWERAGLIRAVRLPSGFRRFQAAEVERLRAQMYAQAADEDTAAGGRELRPNVGPEELRRDYLSSSSVERLRQAAELSRAATTLAAHGERSRERAGDDD
jgi:excisionase family DNA binding protein